MIQEWTQLKSFFQVVERVQVLEIMEGCSCRGRGREQNDFISGLSLQGECGHVSTMITGRGGDFLPIWFL